MLEEPGRDSGPMSAACLVANLKENSEKQTTAVHLRIPVLWWIMSLILRIVSNILKDLAYDGSSFQDKPYKVCKSSSIFNPMAFTRTQPLLIIQLPLLGLSSMAAVQAWRSRVPQSANIVEHVWSWMISCRSRFHLWHFGAYRLTIIWLFPFVGEWYWVSCLELLDASLSSTNNNATDIYWPMLVQSRDVAQTSATCILQQFQKPEANYSHSAQLIPPGCLCILSTQRSLSGPPQTERADGQYNIINLK